jgi:pimeloyl-ACP methyl ester carboxylesterase
MLVGHSMGGAIAQMAVISDPQAFSGACMLAPLPHNGMRPLDALRMLLRGGLSKAQKKLMAGELLSAEETRRLSFFGGRITLDEAARYGALLQPESRSAIKDIMTFRVPPAREAPPLLVLGSANDVLFGRGALKRTARHHGADLDVMEEACHDIMLDPLRDEGAARLLAWMERKGL